MAKACTGDGGRSTVDQPLVNPAPGDFHASRNATADGPAPPPGWHGCVRHLPFTLLSGPISSNTVTRAFNIPPEPQSVCLSGQPKLSPEIAPRPCVGLRCAIPTCPGLALKREMVVSHRGGPSRGQGPRSNRPHRTDRCTGPAFAGSQIHHDDGERAALGAVTDQLATIPILLRQRRSVGCFAYP